MNSHAILSSALASVLALGLAGTAAAEGKAGKAGEAAKEKCYGVAKAGQNDCANLSGTHSCAGQAKVDKSADEWNYVAQGTCKQLGGMTAAEVKKK